MLLMDNRAQVVLMLMLLTGKVAAGDTAFFLKSSLSKALNYGKVYNIPAKSGEALPHKVPTSPCLQLPLSSEDKGKLFPS